MVNFFIRNVIKRAAIKLVTDKNTRKKVQMGLKKAKELNSKGELLKTLGKAAGRLKRKIRD